ncbi:hypothetical protein [Chryseobacterium sp. ERMR1:04]|uniref:hypothetical protein n=1 Tax=Chryseobacterium sp. ERMR1:04 TaxID=1705393 RepID=UPI0006C83737|nr:hypothetical protein [Chryseobacterium sp. ERMR1:04]KPH12846.1 hypothetical protein AMQ68_14360 [Chryseobacterium sp. ERMR1:04]
MIINEILEILSYTNSNHSGVLLNSLYDQFREGRDPNDILTLLNSEDEQIRYFGCSIVNETVIKDKKAHQAIMDKLYDILKNDTSSNNMVRAYHALYGMYCENDDENGYILLCEEMIKHPVNDIRDGAKEFIERNKNKSQPDIIFEISKILSYNNRHHIDILLDNLYFQFGFRRDLNDILILLNSDNQKMVDFGCHFANAVNIKDRNLLEEIIDKLNDILKKSKIVYQRERSFDALCRFYTEDNDEYRLILLCKELENDENDKIRKFSREFINQ